MDDGMWIREFQAAIIVCNSAGIILTMNNAACGSFEKEGGRALIGTNLLDCHPEPARTKVRDLLKSGSANIYTIEKAGIKKLIYQAPWYDDGRYAGFVELSLPIPKEMPHFNRDVKPGQQD